MGHQTLTLSEPRSDRAVFVLDDACDIAGFEALVSGQLTLSFAPSLEQRVRNGHETLCRAIADGRHIYGINTGFGALAGRMVDGDDLPTLQKNLVYHLATGVGAPLSWAHGRALLLARLIVLSKGYSGCDVTLLALMRDVLNIGLSPVVPEKGTVGASGDLTPSSHMALALMGEGAFIAKDGTRYDHLAAFDAFGMTPLVLKDREGLALVNGTSAMTGIAALNAAKTARALNLGLRSAAAYADIMGARTEAYDAAFSMVRPHPGQTRAQEILRDLLHGSTRLADQPIALQTAAGRISEGGEGAWPQDPYSLRCLPQIFGAVFDAVAFHDDIVARELHSVTDNPLIVADEPYALHGGNFYGQHVGFASDMITTALIKLGVLLE
ncbi:MAG: aromatic amino acid ammonia-lyase, partial [Pseudomonadota bacterium]